MSDRVSEIEKAFQALKNVLKSANIDALEKDDFAVGRELTSAMEQLSRLQSSTLALLRSETAVFEQTNVLSNSASADSRYPRFFRSGSTLYKEGLRQDGESLYLQKVEFEAFEQIFRSILEQNRKFKASKVIKESGQPSYQIYILLNVMQDAGLVENPERGVYRLEPQAKHSEPATFWNSIGEGMTRSRERT